MNPDYIEGMGVRYEHLTRTERLLLDDHNNRGCPHNDKNDCPIHGEYRGSMYCHNHGKDSDQRDRDKCMKVSEKQLLIMWDVLKWSRSFIGGAAGYTEQTIEKVILEILNQQSDEAKEIAP